MRKGLQGSVGVWDFGLLFFSGADCSRAALEALVLVSAADSRRDVSSIRVAHAGFSVFRWFKCTGDASVGW